MFDDMFGSFMQNNIILALSALLIMEFAKKFLVQ